jgi:hypothetical protein
MAQDPQDRLAGVRVSWDNRASAIALFEGSITHVEPQIGLACAAIGAVAEEAPVGEQGPDVFVELDLSGTSAARLEKGRREKRKELTFHRWRMRRENNGTGGARLSRLSAKCAMSICAPLVSYRGTQVRIS